MDEKAIARFWSKVDVRGPDECWPWTANAAKRGYGKLKMPNGDQLLSNRIAFFIEHGRWPVFACHTCDNPPCCNQRHIFDGSPQDNVDDMVTKNRQARGEDVSRAYLNAATVLAIRASSLPRQKAAAEFGTSAQNIYMIRSRRTWKHL